MSDEQTTTVCPWPAKVRYETDSAAAAHRRGMVRGGAKRESLTIYRCPSGEHWHLGNSSRFAKVDERIPGRQYARRPADARRGRGRR